MQRMPVRSGNGGDTFADGFDQRLQVLERAARQHAMTEVEDVARPPGGLPEHLARTLDHELDRTEQHGRIEVPLHPAIVADAPPARVEVDAPVEGDDIGAGSGDQLQQPSRRSPEVDRGYTQRARRLEDS